MHLFQKYRRSTCRARGRDDERFKTPARSCPSHRRSARPAPPGARFQSFEKYSSTGSALFHTTLCAWNTTRANTYSESEGSRRPQSGSAPLAEGTKAIGAADANGDGQVTVADVFYRINYLSREARLRVDVLGSCNPLRLVQRRRWQRGCHRPPAITGLLSCLVPGAPANGQRTTANAIMSS